MFRKSFFVFLAFAFAFPVFSQGGLYSSTADFPVERGVKYLSDDDFSQGNVGFSSSMENFCCPSYERLDCVYILDSFMIAKGVGQKTEDEVKFVRSGSKVRLSNVAGYGIKNDVLFMVYYAMVTDSSGYSNSGFVRGCDIACEYSVNTVEGKNGITMSIAQQHVIPSINSNEYGRSKDNLVNRLNNWWTYEGAGLKGGYKTLSAIYFDSTGRTGKINIETSGGLEIEYPMNMTNPVPFVLEHCFSGGQGGGYSEVRIHTLDVSGKELKLNKAASYGWCDTDGGPTGMGYHYYTKDSIVTYEFQREEGSVDFNRHTIYKQSSGNPYSFSHYTSRNGEPSGRNKKSIEAGEFYNPICRLKMRDHPNLGASKLYTLNPGSLVLILEVGSTATIDGISAPWVKVELVNPVGFLEGYKSKSDTTGWVFSGYLE
ncbi:SH3 domain-containing protein [Treponema sp.]|uniref:SH3 domain-containing protein n=1 Tax=Treponema sp. TaxID=166 RepID=UPI00298DD1B7|nr:SH3 domain-containing protein [Treponema sp.]